MHAEYYGPETSLDHLSRLCRFCGEVGVGLVRNPSIYLGSLLFFNVNDGFRQKKIYRDEIINLGDPDKLNIRYAETLGNYLKNVVSDFENFHFFSFSGQLFENFQNFRPKSKP